MKFKKNITGKIGCIISEFLVSCLPAILLIMIFFTKSGFNDILSGLFVIPYFLVIINIILVSISIIYALFDKTFYKIYNDRLVAFDKGHLCEILYSDITSITFDFGTLDRFNAQKMQLIIWGNDSIRLLIINNPSLIMTHMLKIKSGVSLNYLNGKRRLFIFVITNAIVLFFAVFIKLFS